MKFFFIHLLLHMSNCVRNATLCILQVFFYGTRLSFLDYSLPGILAYFFFASQA